MKSKEIIFTDTLEGTIENVTFFSEESGFAVLRVQVSEKDDLVTVVGAVASVHEGEWVRAKGRWERDKRHGMQFRAEELHIENPHSKEGIERYLGSGLIKGVGPVYAKKLTDKFGQGVFDVIENFSTRLAEVGGLGTKKRKEIRDSWMAQRSVREIMIFLYSHGVGTNRAVKIYKTYGDSAIERVKQNPYDLAKDVHGIGFKIADQIAEKLGIARDSEIRLRAGLRYVLQEQTSLGHCALPEEMLLTGAAKVLEVEEDSLANILKDLIDEGEFIRENVAERDLIFLPWLLAAEKEIAARLRNRAGLSPLYPEIDLGRALAWAEKKTGKFLAAQQRHALEMTLNHRTLVITGGPGVGKSTILHELLLILKGKGMECLLCAPTGRAAKRMSELTGLEAKTIHRLLEYQPIKGFLRGESYPLKGNVLVVDEMSMVDVPLFCALLRAIPEGMSLVLIGDGDQLPSVGPGLVLQHIMEWGKIPVVRLTEVFRQAAGSQIIQGAHAINMGKLPEWDKSGDFHFIERESQEDILETLLEVVEKRLPSALKISPDDIQVLTPMNKGLVGVKELNARLQTKLNPLQHGEFKLEKFGVAFHAGDKVIQTVNNYDKEVFNGDIGRVVGFDTAERKIFVNFDSRLVDYGFDEIDEIQLAYAITIHKSQGSEFPAVVIPLCMQHYLLLQRNLIYTAVTRGKRMVVILGQRNALNSAIRNHRTAERFSGLLEWLRAS
ncbi:MAG: ATP-dependent RecD-like DNA helicase [Verrucomicrobiota bacterium]